jgi:hypothetical protein
MGTCFVIQPLDGSVFDKRYRDIFKPAIEAAGLKAYRVDEDPAVDIPIDDIERGIREAEVCLAEITTDNPNVWFELGYAIAARKELVLVCSNERGARFPFDVQHRNIIRYGTDSLQDYVTLGESLRGRGEILANVQSRSAPRQSRPWDGGDASRRPWEQWTRVETPIAIGGLRRD